MIWKEEIFFSMLVNFNLETKTEASLYCVTSKTVWHDKIITSRLRLMKFVTNVAPEQWQPGQPLPVTTHGDHSCWNGETLDHCYTLKMMRINVNYIIHLNTKILIIVVLQWDSVVAYWYLSLFLFLLSFLFLDFLSCRCSTSFSSCSSAKL